MEPCVEAILEEKKTLLNELKYSDLLLKLGNEIEEPYCAQFNDSGYDLQYNRLDLNTAIIKIAEEVTDDQFVSFFSESPAKSYAFLGHCYTMRDSMLSCGTEWPVINEQLVKLTDKHSNNLAAILQSCYTACIEKEKQRKNYLHIRDNS